MTPIENSISETESLDFIPPVTNVYHQRLQIVSAIGVLLVLVGSAFVSFAAPEKTPSVEASVIDLSQGIDPPLSVDRIESLDETYKDALDNSVSGDTVPGDIVPEKQLIAVLKKTDTDVAVDGPLITGSHINRLDNSIESTSRAMALTDSNTALEKLFEQQIKAAEEEMRMRMMAPSVLNNKAVVSDASANQANNSFNRSPFARPYDAIQTQLNQLASASNANTIDERNLNERFRDTKTQDKTAVAYAGQRWDLRRTILEGKLISGVLENAIDSSLPGRVRALVDRNVFAEQGQQVLIPKGSRLVGEYNSRIQQGQQRIFIFWKRLIRPDGVDIDLDSSGSDALGRAGMAGDVDTHFWTRFGTSILLSLIGGGTANIGSSTDQGSASLYRTAIAQSFGHSSRQELDRYTKVPPTIRLNQGEVIHIFVAKDLAFSTRLAGLE